MRDKLTKYSYIVLKMYISLLNISKNVLKLSFILSAPTVIDISTPSGDYCLVCKIRSHSLPRVPCVLRKIPFLGVRPHVLIVNKIWIFS